MNEYLLRQFVELSVYNEKSLEQTGLKLMEESGEVAEALLSFTNAAGSIYKAKDYHDLVEELVDVIMVAQSMLYRLGANDALRDEVLEKKIKKWAATTAVKNFMEDDSYDD